jgi:gliding motility-associated-like protein
MVNGGLEDLPSTFYDRGLVMGPMHDLLPGGSTSPSQRIQYQTVGTAPHRRWVLSFYKVPLFSCTNLIENTHQIVLYESTGIIEIIVNNKQTCSSWNSGGAMIGIQDFTQTQAVMAPGRAATNSPWGSVNMNESWRFVPSGGPSLFKRVELCDLTGNILSTGTVVPTGTGSLEASFPNTCVPAAGLTTYIIRSVYSKIDNPATEIFGVDTVRVTRANGINATTSSVVTTCDGASNGSITVNATSGTPPLNWSIDGGALLAGPSPYTFSNLTSGPHTVNITDANGCVYSTIVNVLAGPPVTASFTKTDALCYGTATGTITMGSPTAGAAPFEYSLDGTNWQSSNIFTGLNAGTYTVNIRSSEGCPAQVPVTIAEPTTLTAGSFTSNGTCNGGNDGTITVNASGGTLAYQYSIDGTNFQSSNIFNVVPGAYTVTVKDNNGCITTIPAVVDLTNDLTVSPQTDETICEGISVQLQVSSNGLQFDWSPPLGLSNTTIPDPVANPTISTEYIVKVTRGVCVQEDTVMVNVNAAPIPSAGPDGFICYGQTHQLQGSGGTVYSWSPDTWLDDPDIADPVSTPIRNVTYVLSILSDANGCASLTKDSMLLDVTPPIKVATYPFDSIGYPGEIFHLLAVPNDSDVVNYSWSPSIGLSDANIKNPDVTVGAIGDDVTYQVITSTIAGCRGEGYIRVRSYKGPEIYIVTGFSPNGDGLNDRFIPFPVGIKQLKYFRVFNRWGQMLFSTTSLHDGWDGKLSGRDQPSGVYVWMAEAVTDAGQVITKKGTVTLIR